MEFPAAAFVEAAEHLIIFQTEYLDTYDQALHCAYESIAQHDDQPVDAAPALSARQHEHNAHHGCMADSKCADTDEGKGVGEITQHDLEQFKEALNKEHDLSALHNGLFFLDDSRQRLFQHDQYKRHAEHNDQDRGCRKGMTRQVQQDHNGQCPVEYKAADGILVKQDIFRIMAPHRVDDVEDHGQQYEEHTKDDRHDEHGVHVAKARYIGHGIHRPQPYG